MVEDNYEIPEPAENYISRESAGTGRMDSQKFNPDAAPADSREEELPAPLVEAAGSQTDPVILPMGGGTGGGSGSYQSGAVIFWLMDDKDREDINRTELVCARFDGSSWSEPMSLLDEGTADCAPRAVSVEDTIYVIWQNADQTFDNWVSAEQYALSMDIYAAVIKNGEVMETVNLTENIPGYCGMHELFVEDGAVRAVWAAYDAGDLLFAEGVNKTYEAVYQGGKWVVSDMGQTAASHSAIRLAAYNSSVWNNIEYSIYESTDLMTAAIYLPEEMADGMVSEDSETGTMISQAMNHFLLPCVIGGIVILAAAVTGVLVVKKRKG